MAKKTAAVKSAKFPPVVASLRKQVVDALDELKARDVREIDVRGKTSSADLLIVASGTSTRHVKSIADEVVRWILSVDASLEHEPGLPSFGRLSEAAVPAPR